MNRIIVKKKNAAKKRKILFLSVMLAFPVLHFLVFWVYVNFNSILLAFQIEANGVSALTLSNFKMLFTELRLSDSNIWMYLKNTLAFFPLGTLIALPLAAVMSYFLFKKVPFSPVFRVIFFMPSIISAVALTMLFSYIVNMQGSLNYFLDALGIGKVDFLGSDTYAFNTVLFYTLWSGLGYSIILLSSAIGRVPQSVFESVKIDGAGLTREFIFIVLPLIWPTISTLVVINVANLFAVIGPVLLLTNGSNNTGTIAFFIYNSVKYGSRNAYGYASAVGLFFTCIGIPLVFGARWVMSKIAEDAEF
jgi:ABC-type sugar transport system permease subunit